MVVVARKLVKYRKCCIVNYMDPSDIRNVTQFWNMGHILLGRKQIRNPLSLQKNLIITGPNAAGKTTYVRAVCTNTILAQTFGIACAVRANISIIHAIGSFMRIEDSLGQASLFEAEAKRCAELLEQAETIVHNGKTALYFLDEPMHSTPPIEGCATSMAVIEYMGRLPGIRLMVTTHYHDCIQLEEMHPNYFQNISMDAYVNNENGLYIFPYKIKNGASIKCIALELLNEKKLPGGVVKRAIDLKNKICAQQVNKST
jgi:DNA mismatch repair ATPase MutS